MTNDSPFFLTKVECPLCRTINEFETVRMGAYVEEGRDTDFCPTGIKWRYPKYQNYNPLIFFIACCSNCYYSRELSASFKDWKNDHTYRTYRLKTIKEKHLDQLAGVDSFVKKIGEAIDISRYPHESAILKLHLAIFDEQLTEHYSKLDIGRFYLRIGWVFRSLEQGGNPQQSILQGLMLDLDTKHQMLKNAMQEIQDQLNRFSEHLSSHFDAEDITAELKSQIYPYRDRFDEVITSVREALGQVRGGFGKVDDLLGEYKSVALGGHGSDAGLAFRQYPSFTDFLLNLKSEWGWTVTNEHEALKKAVEYYKAAFSDGRDIAPGNQQIQASYLIAELSRRTGNYDEARQYFNSTIRHGQEFIHKNRHDRTQTALARKILELAVEQGKSNMAAIPMA